MGMNVNLTPYLDELVRSKVSSGMYTSASEVVREALRLMDEQDRLRQAKLDELRREVREGIDSGTGEPWDSEVAVERDYAVPAIDHLPRLPGARPAHRQPHLRAHWQRPEWSRQERRSRDELAPGVRSLAFGRYVVFFEPLQDGIDVVRVLHGTRDIDANFEL